MICNTALPSSAFTTRRPLSRRSPSTRAPASASIPSSGAGSGHGSGSGSPTSIGMPDQNGERHAAGPGSSQASSDHASAARSASPCTLMGNAADSKRTAPACAAHAAQ